MTLTSFVHDSLTTISNKETFPQEAFASELLENLDEMFPRYYMHSSGNVLLSLADIKYLRVANIIFLQDIFRRFKHSVTHWGVTRHKGFNSNLTLTFVFLSGDDEC